MARMSQEHRTILVIIAILFASFAFAFTIARAVCSSAARAAALLAGVAIGALVVVATHVSYLTSSQLPDRRRVLSRGEARQTYDRMGAQIRDSESAYGGPAVRSLVGAGAFRTAGAVFEFGCGPGRLARKLLDEELPRGCRYVAVDQSPVMVSLASKRLAAEIAAGSCQVKLINGDPHAPEVRDLAPGAFDAVVSTYVLDLLSEEDAQAVLAEAWRLLKPGGRLCVAGITFGDSFASSAVAKLWEFIHWARPATVGGCRHQDLVPYLKAGAHQGQTWKVVHHEKIPGFGSSLLAWLWSEVVVAVKEG